MDQCYTVSFHAKKKDIATGLHGSPDRLLPTASGSLTHKGAVAVKSQRCSTPTRSFAAHSDSPGYSFNLERGNEMCVQGLSETPTCQVRTGTPSVPVPEPNVYQTTTKSLRHTN
ncbi:hypothetical protein ElyMa_002029200 [Elysia marginata]|uniref:Uncharacterized protein n=1 Tax=Elysia marginata TaxID=1093978 RepID=A0AAV4F6A8_9GAST|nr:hypothetical protein ElyMa_002029200 [Elysia marginata]